MTKKTPEEKRLSTCRYCGKELKNENGRKIHETSQHSGDDIDYQHIYVPPNGGFDNPTEIDYNERRAEILTMWYKKGSLDALSTGRLADRYGVSAGQISQDKKILREYIADTPEIKEKLRTLSQVGFQTIYHKAMEKGDLRTALSALESANKWAENRGIQDKEPERYEHDVRAVEFNLDETVKRGDDGLIVTREDDE